MFDLLPIEFDGWPVRLLLELGFILYALVAAVLIIHERRRPAATLAWLAGLIFLPVLGVFLYLVFGRLHVRRALRRRRRRRANPTEATRDQAAIETCPEDLPESTRGLIRLALNTAAAPLRHADDVRVLSPPRVAFDAMERAIQGARRRIHVEFYIWRDDETGRRWVELLRERAQAGVLVRVLVDDVGAMGTPARLFEPLREAGGEVLRWGRLRLSRRLAQLRHRINYRNHRKLLTIDGRVGFLGGVNIGDEYLGRGPTPRPWSDLQVELTGDAVLGLDAIFYEDWVKAHEPGALRALAGTLSSSLTRSLRKTPLPLADDEEAPARDDPGSSRSLSESLTQSLTQSQLQQQLQRKEAALDAGLDDLLGRARIGSTGALVQIIPSGPDLLDTATIAAQYLAAIATAQRRCWIATPYLIPDELLKATLQTAALRGVDVRILVPAAEHNDSWFVALAARSYFDPLLESGCRLFEFTRGMLHSKFLIIDDRLVAIGSPNMDIRSFYLNYEVTGLFYGPELVGVLEREFEAELAGSTEVTPESRAGLPLRQQLGESFARLLSPLL